MNILRYTVLTVLLICAGAKADDVAVTGYEVRAIETTSGNTETIDVGNVLTRAYGAIQQGFTYAFNVRAYDIAGNYSPWSNKRLYTVPVGGDAADQTNPYIFQDGVSYQFQDGEAYQFQSGGSNT